MNNSMSAPSIQKEDLRLAFFFSLKDLNRARSLFCEDKEFQNIPCDDSPPLSLVVPSRAISLLKKRGFCFQVKEPIMHSLTSKQRKALKKDEAVLWGSLFGVTFFLERVSVVVEKGGNFYVKNKKS